MVAVAIGAGALSFSVVETELSVVEVVEVDELPSSPPPFLVVVDELDVVVSGVVVVVVWADESPLLELSTIESTEDCD